MGQRYYSRERIVERDRRFSRDVLRNPVAASILVPETVYSEAMPAPSVRKTLFTAHDLPRNRTMAKHPASHAVFLLGILLLAPTGLARAQDSVLAGVVLSATSSLPLEGARLTVDGSPLIQTSDANGRFRFAGVEAPQVTLRIVRVGYQPVAVVARTGDTDIQIRLREAAVQLNEIVVTGQAEGTERRAVGNSIVTIDAPAALGLSAAEDVTRLLNGRAEVLTVVPNSGRIGAGPSITVRGLGSISLNTKPLVYLDGVRVNNDVSS